jgi:hypothetical protein
VELRTGPSDASSMLFQDAHKGERLRAERALRDVASGDYEDRRSQVRLQHDPVEIRLLLVPALVGVYTYRGKSWGAIALASNQYVGCGGAPTSIFKVALLVAVVGALLTGVWFFGFGPGRSLLEKSDHDVVATATTTASDSPVVASLAASATTPQPARSRRVGNDSSPSARTVAPQTVLPNPVNGTGGASATAIATGAMPTVTATGANGQLTLISAPPCDAAYDNGVPLGQCPIVQKSLPVGDHSITLVINSPHVEKVTSVTISRHETMRAFIDMSQ